MNTNVTDEVQLDQLIKMFDSNGAWRSLGTFVTCHHTSRLYRLPDDVSNGDDQEPQRQATTSSTHKTVIKTFNSHF